METFIGAVELFSFGFEPMDWFLCDGRLLNISQYDVLYSLLGNQFGGDGINTFALPNLLGTEPMPGMNFYIATAGDYPVRS